jgi:glycosyltransferase involved in cell wall biosynthesis
LNYIISVITINLNNLQGLKTTINSVLSQDYSDIEYIIIDGGSTDGSCEFISSVSSKLSYFICEKDEGIYSAMNKGIVKAKGDYLIFLNSGDFFARPDSLSSIYLNSIDKSIIYGNMLLEKNGNLTVKRYPQKLGINFFLHDTLPHPSTLIRRNLFEKFNLYNTNYSIISDWAFFIDAIIKKKVSYQYVDSVISVFNLNGVSSQSNSYKIINSEKDIHFRNNYVFFFIFSKTRWLLNYYMNKSFQLFRT